MRSNALYSAPLQQINVAVIPTPCCQHAGVSTRCCFLTWRINNDDAS